LKVLVAMSGGVDSSVAAALLKEKGHEVTGATMLLRPVAGAEKAVEDARQAAEKLGIPHHIFDFSDTFSHTVIDYFCQEYRLGHTPNPCVFCNRQIKFGALWEKAREMGADHIATGHYAAIRQVNNRFLLKKGADPNKDQSYFLYRLTQEQLSHAIFPLASLTKEKVKQMAQEMGLPTATRPESQEICFIPDNDYTGFLKEHAITSPPGPIVDSNGKELGQHQGIIHYTIGQRKKLGVTSAESLYVTGINAATNTVTVGTKEQTYNNRLVAADLNWISIPALRRPFSVKARVRYRHPEAEASVHPIDDKEVLVKFAEPQMAITPGQSVVFYEEDVVIGGGIIIKQGR